MLVDCMPACTAQGGMYPSMHWAEGVCIPACTGQGEGCLPGGCLPGCVCCGGLAGESAQGRGCVCPSCEQNDRQV